MSKYFILQDISLYSVSGTYAGLGVVLLAIMVVMLFARMPEGKEIAGQARNEGFGATFGRLLRNRKYAWGVVAQFFYVGAQIGASGLIMAILGGALLTPIQGMVSDATGSINLSYLVPLGCFVVVMLYALFVSKDEKILSDTHSC